MQQVFSSADMAQISPANTNPELTQGKNWQTAQEAPPYKTYFRTATTDALQGGFAADYAFNDAQEEERLRRRRQADLRRRPRQALQRGFTKAGGKIAGTDHVNTGDKDFATLVTKIKNSKRRPASTTAASTTSPR